LKIAKAMTALSFYTRKLSTGILIKNIFIERKKDTTDYLSLSGNWI